MPLLKVSKNDKYLITEQGDPFLWLGGTGWEMIHRLKKQEIDEYLSDRSEKGFTVIQTVVLAELDGLNVPNAYGEKPLINNDPTRINEKYFELVDYVVEKANTLGLYVALLPTWGDKFNKRWGVGPEIFNPENARIYGQLLAKRYLNNNNIIWVLGGDRIPENEEHYQIIRQMAEGIKDIDTIHLMSYHPSGAKMASEFFKEDKWLDIDMFQSGHSRIVREYDFVAASLASDVKRPVINAEARYENIPDRFWENKDHGWLDDADVRVSAYWSMLAGAAGYTYGCNDIWQMFDTNKDPILFARTEWKSALDLPGSTHVKYLKQIFDYIPWQTLYFNPSLVKGENPKNESHIIAAITEQNDLMVAYTPMGKPMHLDLTQLDSGNVLGYWFNPRSGTLKSIGLINGSGTIEFSPWATGWGSDFMLILVSKDTPVHTLLEKYGQ